MKKKGIYVNSEKQNETKTFSFFQVDFQVWEAKQAFNTF